jgi:uncharacterized protein DUF6789
VIGRVLGGAAAGLVATLGMSAWMLVAQRVGWLSQQPPEKITHESIRRTTGVAPSGTSLDFLTALMHLGIGAGMGAAFGVIAPRRLAAWAVSLLGVGYGLAIWLINYGHILPDLDLMPPPSEDERRRPQVMVVGHVVYGALLGATLSVLHDRSVDERINSDVSAE